MSYKLYLDDIRNPADSGWRVVRNFSSFTQHIRENGNPDIISFDHDLGEDMHQARLTEGVWSKRKSRSLKKFELTGYDCAKWYLKYANGKNWDVCKVLVHSMNTVGADNIRNVFK